MTAPTPGRAPMRDPANLTPTMREALQAAAQAPLAYSVAGWKHADQMSGFGTPTIDALVDRGLVRISRHDLPKRFWRIELTRAGRGAIPRAAR